MQEVLYRKVCLSRHEIALRESKDILAKAFEMALVEAGKGKLELRLDRENFPALYDNSSIPEKSRDELLSILTKEFNSNGIKFYLDCGSRLPSNYTYYIDWSKDFRLVAERRQMGNVKVQSTGGD